MFPEAIEELQFNGIASSAEDNRPLIVHFVVFILHSGSQLVSGNSMYYSGLYGSTPLFVRQYRIAEIGRWGKAIILLGENASIRNDHICVVPVALSGPSCALSRRLWVLSPQDGFPNVWRIVEKLAFFNMSPTLEEDLEAVRLRDQIILGSLLVGG